MPRRLTLGTCLAAVLAVTVAPARAGQTPGDKPFPKFEDTWTWFRLAAQHHIGRVDGPLKTLAGWPAYRVHRVRHDLQLIQTLLANAVTGRSAASTAAVRTGAFRADALSLSVVDLERLLGLPPGVIGPDPDPRHVADPPGAARRAIAVAMARGVALHTDLMLAAANDPDLMRMNTPGGSATRIVDGERSAISSSAVYWDVARVAMDQVAVTPRSEALARDWYHASSEFLLSRREYDAAVPHVTHGRLALKDDGRMAFYAGVIFENLASPNVQVAVGDNPAAVGIDKQSVLLLRSEDALRAALKLDPGLDEAALRLARVLQTTGRHDDAIPLLDRVEKTLERSELRYCAALFRGRAAEARGDDADARAAYERARKMFPDAQSPHLALAALSWRAADGGAAAREVGALAGPEALRQSIDPWWIYDVLPADSLLQRLAAARLALDAFLK